MTLLGAFLRVTGLCGFSLCVYFWGAGGCFLLFFFVVVVLGVFFVVVVVCGVVLFVYLHLKRCNMI